MNTSMGFLEFVKKIIGKLMEGKRLSLKEIMILKFILEKLAERNRILARAILKAFDSKESKKYYERLVAILDKATERIIEGKPEVFTREEEEEIVKIFKNCNLPSKSAKKFISRFDGALSMELSPEKEEIKERDKEKVA